MRDCPKHGELARSCDGCYIEELEAKIKLLQAENEDYRTKVSGQYVDWYYTAIETLGVSPGDSTIDAIDKLIRDRDSIRRELSGLRERLNFRNHEHADSCHFEMDDSATCDCYLGEAQELARERDILREALIYCMAYFNSRGSEHPFPLWVKLCETALGDSDLKHT